MIVQLQQELQQFEASYKLLSEEFYARYCQGDMGDEMDFIEWAATIEMFADELSISRRTLDRKLIALSGESPSDIIKRVRLTHASKLLAQNSGNISEVALEVGFSNPAYFTKCFSEQFGFTPSEFQTNHTK